MRYVLEYISTKVMNEYELTLECAMVNKQHYKSCINETHQVLSMGQEFLSAGGLALVDEVNCIWEEIVLVV